ncbi:hypothetical protein QLQ12_34040 [Actinoplanes sp. NEAU-A12]|uniref:Uncharacterized protein n=1 Tax=Actinoplanes sandaracinus TaxID=3045177 RepID=A0ABT6WV69_9ACTN|nr:hypothetical protein [Actinoplanes sandaracinus]MDI6103646.1 hypothetical protein [Actinoplanes sandaracinus]
MAGRAFIGGPETATREPTIFFFEGERAGLAKRRAPLAGFRALLVGGAGLVLARGPLAVTITLTVSCYAAFKLLLLCR